MAKPSINKRWRSAALRWLLPALLLATIAWPDYTRYLVWPTAVDAQQLASLRQLPDKSLLLELGAISLAPSLGVGPSERPQAAQLLLQGSLTAPAFTASPVPLRGWPHDLKQPGTTFELSVASLAAEDLLLDEYESSQDASFYRAARDRVLQFAAWEQAQTQPVAFLWNDHAVAARVSVLVRLWLHLRGDPEASAAQQTALLDLVNRSGELLAKPNQFTARTNHGVMQNLALLQIGAAFPSLAKAAEWRALALQRLELQLGFYVSSEGVVLEHSAEYHLLGTELLAYAARMAKLNGQQPSARLQAAVRESARFARQLLRPDGSLPAFGNTAALTANRLAMGSEFGDQPVSHQAPPFAVPAGGHQLYPLSGYAVWWRDGDAPVQTVVSWAKHDRHGHKHADEPGLHFWSRGHNWITATGYWPYDMDGLEDANGWPGANAPHGVGESAESSRTVRALAVGSDARLALLDVQNCRASGTCVRRQVVQLSAEELLVLDEVAGATGAVQTLWTTDPRLELVASGPAQFISSATASGDLLQITLGRHQGTFVPAQLRKGSLRPFVGWVVVGNKPTPASALQIEQAPPGGLTAALFSVRRAAEPTVVTVLQGADSQHWQIQLDRPSGQTTLARAGLALTLAMPGVRHELALAETAPLTQQREALRAQMGQALALYPPWRDLGLYRRRLYLAVPVLAVAAEGALWALARHRRVWRLAQGLLVLGWIGLGAWLNLVYLT